MSSKDMGSEWSVNVMFILSSADWPPSGDLYLVPVSLFLLRVLRDGSNLDLRE